MARARVPGWWYPWIFVGGLVIVIAVNAVMMTLAIGTFPGLETEDAYRKGIEYNQTIAAARAQDARGWHLDLHFTPSPEAGVHGGDVSIAFVDRDGQALRELEVKVDFVRPLGEGSMIPCRSTSAAAAFTVPGLSRRCRASGMRASWLGVAMKPFRRRGGSSFRDCRIAAASCRFRRR
ncbi:MAG: FixH family protein [Rhodospirillales bacterium]|nr:FixH family protein [Rhodospirillales bacterium]